MAILPSIDSAQTKRELTPKQESFLEHLIECQGDAKKAAELAGYSSHYHHVVKTLKSEILELTQEILANSAPKAAFKLVEVMEAEHSIPQSNVKIQAAQTILDRIGLGKADRIDINHKVDESSQGSLFILPAKAAVTVDNDAEYTIPED